MTGSSEALCIKSLCMRLNSQPLISKFDLKIQPGETVALMGASGSGKSTLLSWMCGMLSPSFTASGELWLGQKRIDPLPCEKRRLGLLFQDALLFPHLSVGENLMFGVPESASKKERVELAARALETASLHGTFDQDPATLSGGQRARVSLMRTLLSNPCALLLDEPFSRLDQALRTQFREFVLQLTDERSLPVFIVTHDPEDVPLGSRCLSMTELASNK